MGSRKIIEILKETIKQIIKEHFSFLVSGVKRIRGYLRLKLEKYRKTISPRVFGERINRNQWINKEGSSWEIYKKMMLWSWGETKSKAPDYFKRLKFTVSKCKGRVLEIGCGIGTMTRWISKSEKVEEIIAIDAFSDAIEELKTYNMPKVKALHMQGENIHFNDTRKFDTVLLCELIEHMYPDEEKEMLKALKQYIHSETTYIVSTPIGFMSDPHHVRGFPKKQFIKHLRKYYGNPLEVDYSSGYSQIAFGYFDVRG